MKTGVVITILFFCLVELANTQTVAKKHYTFSIEKGKMVSVGASSFLNVPVTLTNDTKDTLYYLSMSCSWEKLYSVDNTRLCIASRNCDKNIPKMLKLAPGQSRKQTILLRNEKTKDKTEIKFKIGFYLLKTEKSEDVFHTMDYFYKDRLKKNVIWSNTISM
jgi:hypothetical protein